MNSVRLQKFLANAGLASRRGAEELIRGGSVRVNGRVAQLGMTVDPGTDVITVGRKRVQPSAHVWIALHKPVGHVVSKIDAHGRPTVFDLVPDIPGLTYVGRLDLLTSGLVLLTNDGIGANRLSHPRFGVEKTYFVRVTGQPTKIIAHLLKQPIEIDGRRVNILGATARTVVGAVTEIELVLSEGRNRIVRRICDQLGLAVESLVRTRHGPVRLGCLPVGKWRYLDEVELNAVRTGGTARTEDLEHGTKR